MAKVRTFDEDYACLILNIVKIESWQQQQASVGLCMKTGNPQVLKAKELRG